MSYSSPANSQYYKSLVICQFCSLVVEDPITLPCDCVCCGSHTSDHFALNKLIRCKRCDREHEITSDGFRSSKNAKRILDEESYLTEYEKIIKRKIEEKISKFSQSLSEFSASHANFESSNHEYFVELRRKVDIHREEAKNKIDEIALRMIDELKEKELEYCRTLSESHTNIFELNGYENEFRLILAEFRNEPIPIENVIAMIQEQDGKLKQLERKIKKFKETIDEVNEIEFRKNKDFSDDLFGELSFNASFQKIITGSTDNSIRIHEMGSNKIVSLGNVSNLVGCVMCLESLSNIEFISGANDRQLKIWDARTGTCTKSLALNITGQITCIKAITEDLVAIACVKTIYIWDIRQGICIKTLEGHSSWIRCLAILANGGLASAGQDKTIKIWNINDGVCVKNFERASSSDINCMQGINGILASGTGRIIILWSVETLVDPVGRRCGHLSEHVGNVFALAATKEGYLVSSAGDRRIKIWNVLTNKCLHTIDAYHSAIRQVKVLSNGYLASCSSDKCVRIWKWYETNGSGDGRWMLVKQHVTGHTKMTTSMILV